MTLVTKRTLAGANTGWKIDGVVNRPTSRKLKENVLTSCYPSVPV